MATEQPSEASIFNFARKIDSSEQRAAYLQQACGGDAALRQRVEALLATCGEESVFPEQPAPGMEETLVPGPARENLGAALNAGLAPAFGEDAAVVLGGASHSVLKMISQTLNAAPRVSLRESEAEGPDPITRPSSPEIPKSNADSRYRLDGEIARGGMGAILKGRDTDLGRDLAIKVLLDSHKDKPEVIQRFVEEAQIGGQLQHPGIAPIYELGQFADKRPFFAMKLVKGQTLSKLLADREDAAEERGKFIGIFEQVCQTMAYAHSRGVIHRDLKPANIMVGAFGEVQVMDWGLAKVLQVGGVVDEKKSKALQQGQSIIQTLRSGVGSDVSAFGSAGSHTQMGSVMGTPAYMPPEQALGEIDNMDDRADVFGLGAILCEILTGQPPYVGDDGIQVYRMASRGKLADAFARLDACGADEDLIALTRHCLELEPVDRPRDAGVLAERVTGYLESVEAKLRDAEVQRAAEAARADAEAAQAAAERQRAEAESQRAEAESARANEESKRRRTSLALAASVLLLVGLGGGGWLYMERQESERQAALAAAQTRHAQEMESLAEQRDEQRRVAIAAGTEAETRRQQADEQAEIAQLVSEFLGGLFEDADPVARTARQFGVQKRGEGELTALEVVHRGRDKLQTALLTKPRVRAALLDRIGNVYINLDRVTEAAPLLEEALRIREAEYGADSLEFAASTQSIGLLYMSTGQHREAIAAFERALNLRRRLLEKNDLLIAESLFHLGVQQGFELAPGAEASLQECLAIRRHHFDSANTDVAATLLMLGQWYLAQNELLKALPVLQEAAAMTDKLQGKNDFGSMVSLFMQAQLAEKFGSIQAARKLYDETETKTSNLLGEDHLILAFARGIFAKFLLRNGERAEGIDKLRKAVAVYRRSFGPESPILARRLVELGSAERDEGDFEAAFATLSEGARVFRGLERRHSHPVEHAICLHRLAGITFFRGDQVQAENLYREGLAVMLRHDKWQHHRTRLMGVEYANLLLHSSDNPAVAQLETREEASGSPDVDVKLAEAWSMAAVAHESLDLKGSDEVPIGEFMRRECVVMLQSAITNGLSKRESIQTNPAFEHMRTRTDFLELLSATNVNDPDTKE